MRFKRLLRNAFIDELNRLYDTKNSWWRKMTDDREAFILIRDNRVHVLVNGGLLLQIRMDSKGGMTCEAHEDFLSLRNTRKPYVRLDDDSTEAILILDGIHRWFAFKARGFKKIAAIEWKIEALDYEKT